MNRPAAAGAPAGRAGFGLPLVYDGYLAQFTRRDTARLLALTRGRWTAYHPLFALATVNRETTWFFAVAASRRGRAVRVESRAT